MKRLFARQSQRLALILALACAGFCTGARADVLLLPVFNASYNYLFMQNSGDQIATSFQTDGNVRVFSQCQITLVYLDFNTRHLAVTLAADNDGVPGATVANLGTITLNSNGGEYVPYALGIDPMTLPANTTFWVVMHLTENAARSGLGVGVLDGTFNEGAGYAGPYGGLVVKANSGGGWVMQGPAYAPDVIGVEVDGLNATPPPQPPPALPVKGAAVPMVGGAVFNTLYSAVINSNQAIAYRASIAIPKTPACTIIGRFREANGLDLAARTGTPAPGFTENYQSLGDPVMNANGEVAFTGQLARDSSITAANDAVVWSDLGGGTQPVWHEGDPAPGAAAGQLFKKVSWLNLVQGALFVGAATEDATVTPIAHSSGVWRWDGSSLTAVAIVGQTLTGAEAHGAVATISSPTSTGNGNATSRLASSNGELSLLIKFSDKTSMVVPFLPSPAGP